MITVKLHNTDTNQQTEARFLAVPHVNDVIVLDDPDKCFAVTSVAWMKQQDSFDRSLDGAYAPVVFIRKP